MKKGIRIRKNEGFSDDEVLQNKEVSKQVIDDSRGYILLTYKDGEVTLRKLLGKAQTRAMVKPVKDLAIELIDAEIEQIEDNIKKVFEEFSEKNDRKETR